MLDNIIEDITGPIIEDFVNPKNSVEIVVLELSPGIVLEIEPGVVLEV